MKIIAECPSCGRHTTSAIEGLVFYYRPSLIKFRDRVMKLRPREIDIFEHLVDAHPRYVHSGVLVDDLWPHQEPDVADKSLKVHICNMRKAFKLAGMDLRIKSNGVGGYALEVVNAEANAA